MRYATHILAQLAFGSLLCVSLPLSGQAQSIARDGVNENTGNYHLQSSFTSVSVVENDTPTIDEAAVALSYVAGSWTIILRSEAADWTLARAEEAVFTIDDSTYETTDVHTVDAERTPNILTEENAILAPGELRALIADAEAVRVQLGTYVLDVSDLPDHHALLQTRLDGETSEESDEEGQLSGNTPR